jgi:hypothetical protein
MTENMSQPVFVVVDQDAPAVGTLVGAPNAALQPTTAWWVSPHPRRRWTG